MFTQVGHLGSLGSGQEPTRTELAEIEREWPLIEAELALLDMEIRLLTAEGSPSPLDWRRLRRAEHRVLVAQQCQTLGLTVRPAGPVVA